MKNILKIYLLLIITITIMGCSVFGVRTAEELKYDIVNKSGEIEIREYQAHISAVTRMQGSYEEVQS